MKKKMITLTIALLSSTYLLAHGVGNSWNNNYKSVHMMGNGGGSMMSNNSGYMMGDTSDTLHDSQIKVDSIDDGVSLSITFNNQESANKIQKILNEKQDQLKSYLKNIEVEITPIENGAIVQLTSEDESIVEQLQYDRGMIINHLIMSSSPGYAQGYGDCWSGQNSNTKVN